jgi:hypothetical protein
MTGWDYFAKYVGIQGILALLITSAMVVAWFVDVTIPEQAWTFAGLAWGFYFAVNGKAIVSKT